MLDGQKLASLVASKVCHDMVEPMNAMITGLEMLKSDPSGRNADAIRLLEHGVNKAWAKLDFFRSAMAGGLGGDGEAQIEEMRPTVTRLYGALKPEFVWSAPPMTMPRAALKVLLNLTLIAAECLPKGGTVRLEAEETPAGPEIRLVAEGQRAKLRPETAQVLGGDAPEHGFQGSNVQPALTGLLARQSGLALLTREGPERVELALRSDTFRIDRRSA